MKCFKLVLLLNREQVHFERVNTSTICVSHWHIRLPKAGDRCLHRNRRQEINKEIFQWISCLIKTYFHNNFLDHNKGPLKIHTTETPVKEGKISFLHHICVPCCRFIYIRLSDFNKTKKILLEPDANSNIAQMIRIFVI